MYIPVKAETAMDKYMYKCSSAWQLSWNIIKHNTINSPYVNRLLQVLAEFLERQNLAFKHDNLACHFVILRFCSKPYFYQAEYMLQQTHRESYL